MELFGLFPCFFVFLFAGIVVLGIVLAIVSWQKEKKRREQQLNWAQRKGLQYSPSRDRSFRNRYPHFKCLSQGDQNRYAFNVAWGPWKQRHVVTFDYHYETTSTDSDGDRTTTSHHFSGVILQANMPLKPLVIRAEGFFDRISGFFGFDDIDFESAEFSRQFHVKSPDRKWAYDVLHQRAIEYLLASPRYSIAFDHQNVICWHNRRFEEHQTEAAIHLIEGLLDMMPDYLVQQQHQLHATPGY